LDATALDATALDATALDATALDATALDATSGELVATATALKGGLLHQVEWSRVVYDEAHHLRNSNTALFHGAHMLKGKIHWLVSGTPIQNNIKDFYSLCSILRLPASFYTEKENLALFAKSFLLKRTKRQVGISIAPLTVSKVGVPWTNVHEKELADQIHYASAEGLGNPPHRLFQMLLARQSCIMNGMMLNHLQTLVDWGLVQKKNVVAVKEAFTKKSKLDQVVAELLQRKGNGNGKLVFCHFRQEIDEIARRLREGGMDRVAVIDGRVTKTKKEDALQVGYETLILQIQTGCEGLNLQEHYSEIYFVSPHWNPAVEDQAIARCHRIGQTKPVVVKRFIMESFSEGASEGQGGDGEGEGEGEATRVFNIEEYVVSVQDGKRKVASALMN
jgi:SNF2 family DNA or RNA helicase